MSRILVVSYGVLPAPNHHGVALDNLLKALSTRYEVDAMTVRAGDLPHLQRYRKTRMLRVAVGDGLPTDRDLPPHGPWVEAFRRAVRRQLQGSDYDAVHFRDLYGGQVVCEDDVHDAVLVHELDRPLVSPSSPAVDDERFCLRRATTIIAGCREIERDVSGRVPAGRVVLVSPGVDIDRFDWELMPMPRVPRLVYHGAVAPGRGLRLLMAALPLIIEQRRIVLWVVGGGEADYLEQLRDLAGGVKDRVEFFGAVDHADVPRLLAMGTLGIVPAISARGPCPNKLLEHAACRKPVVAPDVPVLREMFERGDLATFIPGDREDLARVVVGLLENEEQRRVVASSAYQRTRDLHSASSARRRLLGAYVGLAPPFPLPRGDVGARRSPSPEATVRAGTSSEAPATVPNLPTLPAMDPLE